MRLHRRHIDAAALQGRLIEITERDCTQAGGIHVGAVGVTRRRRGPSASFHRPVYLSFLSFSEVRLPLVCTDKRRQIHHPEYRWEIILFLRDTAGIRPL